MMMGLKVGAYVDVLPEYRKEQWARGKKWPSKVTRVLFNDYRGAHFSLDNSGGGWSEAGLVVVTIHLENK